MEKTKIRPYQFIRILSLDIVLGAVAGTYYFSKLFNSQIPIYWYICLALSVWSIYLTDHILDTFKSKANEHLLNQNQLLKIAVVLFNLTTNIFILLRYFPKHLFLPSAIVGFLTIVYLVIIYKWPNFLLKEIVIALIYSLGIVLYHADTINFIIDILKNPTFISYTLLVLGNVCFFSYINSRKQDYKTISIITISISLLISLLLLWSSPILHIFPLVQITMAFTLYLCLYFNTSKNIMFYGALADFAFILPLILFFF